MDTWVYDPNNDTWKKGKKLREHMRGHHCAWLDDEVVLVGGFSGTTFQSMKIQIWKQDGTTRQIPMKGTYNNIINFGNHVYVLWENKATEKSDDQQMGGLYEMKRDPTTKIPKLELVKIGFQGHMQNSIMFNVPQVYLKMCQGKNE